MQIIDYLNVTDKHDSFRLPSAPAAYCLIFSFEIVLSDSFDTHLLLVNQSYAHDGDRPLPCIWSPPFVSFHANPSALAHREMGHVRAMFKKLEESMNEETELSRALYNIGAIGADAERAGDLIEYKRSFREPDKHKCYMIRRFRVFSSEEVAMLNACDPENLMGHVFLPLDNPRDYLTSSAEPFSGARYFYRGKPLASHLCELIDRTDEIKKMGSKATLVPNKLFALQEKGLLIRVDISGYGRFCEYVRQNMGTFRERGRHVEQWLNGALYHAFWRELARCGNARVRMEGDGFLAAVPMEDDSSTAIHDALSKVLKVYVGIAETVKTFNESIRDFDQKVSCRCVVIQGQYRFGKIGQLLARGGEFEGPDITNVTRLDQALKSEIRMALESDQPAASIAIEADCCDGLSLGSDLGSGTRIERKSLSCKERKFEAILCWLP